MQSESTEDPHSTSSDHNAQISSNSSQHGLLEHFNQVTDLLLHREDGRAPQLLPRETDAVSVFSSSSWSTDGSNSRRLSNGGHSSVAHSSITKVEQHEKALVSKQKNRGKFAFQVVPSAGFGKSDRSIDTLPNGRILHSAFR